MTALSTTTHLVKAFLGGSLTSQIHLARGSHGKSLAGRLAMHTIKNREAKLTHDVSRCRLSTNQIVESAMKLAELRNQIKPAGTVGTRISTETNRVLDRIQGKCRSEQGLGQLEVALSGGEKYKRAMNELGTALTEGQFESNRKGNDRFMRAVGVVAMLVPESAGSLAQRQTQILNDLRLLSRQGDTTLGKGQGQYQQAKQERLEALVACARDPKNDAETLADRVKELGSFISGFEHRPLNNALEPIWDRAASETRKVKDRLEIALMKVWTKEVYRPGHGHI